MSAHGEEEFDWRDADALAVPAQAALAVYLNPFGDIVIRQQGACFADEDLWVTVRPENARALVAAILREAGLADLDAAPERQRAMDATGAERARRHRERKRRHAGVTGERNGAVTAGSVTRHGNIGALAPLEPEFPILEAAE